MLILLISITTTVGTPIKWPPSTKIMNSGHLNRPGGKEVKNNRKALIGT